MKKYVLILLIVIGTTAFTKAQKVPTLTELTNKNIEALEKKIKLNPTQRNIIYNYTMDLYREQMSINQRQQTGAYNENDVSKFYKLQNATTANIRNILKGDQQTDYDKYLEEQLRGGNKKKKKGKHSKEEEEEVVTGISGLTLPPDTTAGSKE